MHGQDKNTRAETPTEYFEASQLAVRQIIAFPTHSLNLQSLNVNSITISFEELRAASLTMKRNRQCAADGLPAEFLQTIYFLG